MMTRFLLFLKQTRWGGSVLRLHRSLSAGLFGLTLHQLKHTLNAPSGLASSGRVVGEQERIVAGNEGSGGISAWRWPGEALICGMSSLHGHVPCLGEMETGPQTGRNKALRAPPACDFAEGRVWEALDGGWHCLVFESESLQRGISRNDGLLSWALPDGPAGLAAAQQTIPRKPGTINRNAAVAGRGVIPLG